LEIYRFSVSYDRLALGLTAFAWALILGIAALLLFLAPSLPLLLLLAGLIVAILVLPALYAPIGYELRGGELRILRPIGAVKIPVKDVVKVKRLSLKSRFGLRLWASGGLYGYFGLFWIKDLGKCWFYATRRKDLILIETRKKRYVISPRDVEKFLGLFRL